MRDLLKLIILLASSIWFILSIVGLFVFGFILQDHHNSLVFFTKSLFASFITTDLFMYLFKE